MNNPQFQKKYTYQFDNLYFAQCRHGIENIVADELKELGASDLSPGFSGVIFKAEKEILYSIIYYAKTPSRILAPLMEFRITDEQNLYDRALRLNWGDFLDTDMTFSISSSVSNSCISNSHYASLKLKDSIADYFMGKRKMRPSVEKDSPDVRFNLNIRNNLVRISFDASGYPMHKRGYRISRVAAPLNETLAAAIIRISKWNGDVPLYDPMAGSGTLLAEALLRYKKLPSGYNRRVFGVFYLPDFEKKVWEQTCKNIDTSVIDLPENLVAGSDVDINSINASKKNLAMIPDGKKIFIEKKDFKDIPSLKNRMIITNLPYGKRLGNGEEFGKLYKDFGDFLKKKCTGSIAFLLCGSTNLVKKIGLRTKRKIPIFNGPIETRLVEIDLY